MTLAGRLILVDDLGARDVAGHQVGRELNPAELHCQGLGQRRDGQGLRQARHADCQAVPAAKMQISISSSIWSCPMIALWTSGTAAREPGRRGGRLPRESSGWRLPRGIRHNYALQIESRASLAVSQKHGRSLAGISPAPSEPGRGHPPARRLPAGGVTFVSV